MTMNSKIRIETHITDIIIFDIVGYSYLSDEDQYITIYLINQKLKEFLNILYGQSFLEVEEVILGFVPTGDGAYIVLNHKVAGYGLLLAISLRTSLLQLQNQSNKLFSGLRTAIHFGIASPIEDITGNRNFVGGGLNDCARLLSVEKSIIEKQPFLKDDNYLIISSSALHQFEQKYSGKSIDDFLNTIQLKIGDEIKFHDKHKKEHKAHFLESGRYVAITPPKPIDLKQRFTDIAQEYKKEKT